MEVSKEIKDKESYQKRVGDGLHDMAIKWYNKAIELNPNESFYHSNKGSCLDNLKKYEEAITCYNKAIELNPNDAIYHNKKGFSLHYLQKYEEAINCYNKAIELNPNESVYHSNKGFSLHYLQKYEEAINCYNKAIELNINESVYHSNKGFSLHNLQKYQEAISCYNKAIELNPNESVYYSNKGISLHYLQKYEEAITCFNKAIKLNPNNSIYHNNKARSLNDLLRYEEAITCYNKAIELNPNIAIFHYNKGNFYLDLKDYSNSLYCYSIAISLDSTKPQFYYKNGCALSCLNKPEDAKISFQKALDVDLSNSRKLNKKEIFSCKLNYSYDGNNSLLIFTNNLDCLLNLNKHKEVFKFIVDSLDYLKEKDIKCLKNCIIKILNLHFNENQNILNTKEINGIEIINSKIKEEENEIGFVVENFEIDQDLKTKEDKDKLLKEYAEKQLLLMKKIAHLETTLKNKTIENESMSLSLQELKRELDRGESHRRKLHNYIQELRGNIRVFCRVKPNTNEVILHYK